MPAQLYPISTHPASEVSAKRELDVVFVHGLGGDPFGTWRHGEDEITSWPHWLAEEYGERIGVWSFGYPASKSTAPRFPNQIKKALGFKIDEDEGFSMPLPRRAGNALNKMVNKGIGERPCVFIAHSLGGLLVKSILRQANDAEESSDERRLINNCKAVLFLATPHHGSSLASLYSRLSICFPSITIKELESNDANLENLHEWYQSIVPSYRIQTRSFGENKPTANLSILVVPSSSANPGIAAPHGKNTVYLDVDHLQISRPERPDDDVVVEARKLIKDQLANDQLPLNPQILKSDLSDGSIPDPFSGTDFHLKVSVEENAKSKLRLLRQEFDAGASLSCRVHVSMYRGEEILAKPMIIGDDNEQDSLTFSGNDPEPLIQHLNDLRQQTLSDCQAYLGNSRNILRLYLHLKLPLAWLSGPLPEQILQSLQRQVFFGCSKRAEVAESAVSQLREQAMQVNQRLRSGGGLSNLLWATLCQESAGQTEIEQLFDLIPNVIHLNSPIVDEEYDHRDLVGRDALLATESRLLFADRFSSSGSNQAEASVDRRWRRLVEIGLPLMLWRRGEGSEPWRTNLDHLQVVLKGSWSDLCSHLRLLSRVVNSQNQDEQKIQNLMRSLGIFYEDPLRNPPPPAPYCHPVHAPN
jgi:hypothetical protein